MFNSKHSNVRVPARLSAKMAVKEGERQRPGVLRGGPVVHFRTRVIHEGMPRFFVNVQPVGKLRVFERGQQLGDARHDERIVAAVYEKEGTADLASLVERRVLAVEGRAGLDIGSGEGERRDQPAAHAKPDGADFL